MEDKDRYWIVRLDAFAFESAAEAGRFQDALMNAFEAMPEAREFGASSRVISSEEQDAKTARAVRAEAELAAMRSEGSWYKEADIDRLQDQIARLTAERDAAWAAGWKAGIVNKDQTMTLERREDLLDLIEVAIQDAQDQDVTPRAEAESVLRALISEGVVKDEA